MSAKTIVTARNTITNEQLFIQCKDFKDVFNTAGILNQIELKTHTYKQVRLRSSPCPKTYKRINIADIT